MSSMNAVGWFDIYVNDMKRATDFYETVLKQKLEPLEDPTGETEMMSFSGDMSHYGASGALVKSKHAQPGEGGTLIYFSVENCSEQEACVEAAGGQDLRPKFSIGKFGWVSLCKDTEGNVIGFNSMK